MAQPALAAPKHKKAKAAFDRGVAAYKGKDYEAAADALGESYDLEPDMETLYAWAQAERNLDDCGKASELYRKLLDYKMPVENKQAIRDQIDECKAILEEQNPEDHVVIEPDEQPDRPVQAKPRPVRPAPKPAPAPARWYQDPIGDGLLGTGVVALALGSGFLVLANTADTKAKGSYGGFGANNDLARSRGTLGVAFLAGSGVLVTGAIIRYAVHGKRASKRSESSTAFWIAPTSVGVFARF